MRIFYLFNHAGFSFFAGGFVGVDVFFVISGFLITPIIHPRIQQKTFSFSWFISRRIKRLMPALFAIIFITMGLFTLLMLPQDLVKFYKSIVWVVFYSGNNSSGESIVIILMAAHKKRLYYILGHLPCFNVELDP